MMYFCFLVFYMNAAGFKAQQISIQTSDKGDKRAIGNNKDAFSNDFDQCMINQWKVAGQNGRVLKTSPTAVCTTANHARLCYGTQGQAPAQFISCYNIQKLIPEFTAYIVPNGVYNSAVLGKYNRQSFRQDQGQHAPKRQAHRDNCINPNPRSNNQHYCNRGHLVPSGQFNTKDKRDLTFIMTNVAPQWQPFNGGNWAVVEHAVKEYANAAGHDVYVFTGTAGIAQYQAVSKPNKPGKMVVPKYFWKAVCDPAIRQSIVFIAENNVMVTSQNKVNMGTCTGQPMTKEKGVVFCYSLNAARGKYPLNLPHGFKLPDFDPVNCGTANMGNFLDGHLLGKWQ